MIRTHHVLLVSLGLVAGCATSSANSNSQNPDAGNVQYDVADPGADGANAGADGAAGDAATSGRQPRGATSTRAVGERTGVKRIQAKAPPREDGGGGGATTQPKKGRLVGVKNPNSGGGGTTPAPTEDPNGLIGSAWVLPAGTESLPDFSTLGDPAGTVPVRLLDVKARGTFPGLSVTGDVVGMQFLGSLNVVDEGEYTLCLTSQGGSRLLLDEVPIVDNDGLAEAATEKCETVFMAPGEYGLAVDYFYVAQNGIVLQFAWNRDGGAEKQPVPQSVLFKPGT